MTRNIRVAVCGELPTACDFLQANGVVRIDQYLDATEIRCESDYHLILVYAPHAEGLLNTHYSRNNLIDGEDRPIPIRLLGEPCCKSALTELRSILRRIDRHLKQTAAPVGAIAEVS